MVVAGGCSLHCPSLLQTQWAPLHSCCMFSVARFSKTSSTIASLAPKCSVPPIPIPLPSTSACLLSSDPSRNSAPQETQNFHSPTKAIPSKGQSSIADKKLMKCRWDLWPLQVGGLNWAYLGDVRSLLRVSVRLNLPIEGAIQILDATKRIGHGRHFVSDFYVQTTLLHKLTHIGCARSIRIGVHFPLGLPKAATTPLTGPHGSLSRVPHTLGFQAHPTFKASAVHIQSNQKVLVKIRSSNAASDPVALLHCKAYDWALGMACCLQWWPKNEGRDSLEGSACSMPVSGKLPTEWRDPVEWRIAGATRRYLQCD